jgi:two-component system, sensor histidine kinase and response regulator
MSQWTFVLDECTRILFVDDDLILAEFAKVHLATPVATVESAANGAEAWELLCSQPFDIVLLDIEMPVLDGFGLLSKLRADVRFRDLPVVMLTGREDIASIDRAYHLGATSFTTKPINWRMFSYTLRYVLRSTRMEAEMFRQYRHAQELTKLTNSLLSLLRLEARTRIASIIGFSDCIQQQIDGPISIDSYVGYAEQIGLAARQWQADFLDMVQYAQLSSGDVKLAHDEHLVSAIVDAALASVSQSALRAGVVLNVQRPHEDFYLLCDRHWLSRALSHLLENALGKEGDHSVEFAINRSARGEATFSVSASGDASRNAEQLGSTPDAGATTPLDNVLLGRGIGIPFALRIAELHDGELLQTTGDDGGTKVEIILPARRVIEIHQASPAMKLASSA